MPSRLIMILGVFEWTVERDPESGQQVAECSGLDLLAWGDTGDELLNCIQRVTGMLVGHLLETGRLKNFMESRGHPVVTIPVPKSIPQPLPELGWIAPEMPVLRPTSRIVDASLIHA